MTRRILLLWLAMLPALALISSTQAVDDLIITEFMAANSGTLADEDGDFPDWIEIFNAGTYAANLNGWYLTDSVSRLTKWRFPATNLSAGAYLVVFASGKDRPAPGAPLHTSFNLNSSGEFLALVRPDGTNIASAYAPLFPRQAADVSFGIVTASEAFSLLSSDAVARVLVPADGSLGLSWSANGFDDSSWTAGTNGVGFDFRSFQLISDNFDVAHDYSGKNVTGTIWNGIQWGGDTVVSVANAHTANAGRLTLGSSRGNWENGDNDGILLYVSNVTNDFTAEVEIPASDNPAYHSMGLMARVPELTAAGAGEDWVAAMMFDQYGVGTTVRSTDNGTSTTPNTGVTHRFLQLQRAGNVFSVFSKATAGDTYTLRASVTRSDMAGQPLQVGVWQATYSANNGIAQFDKFVLKLGAADSGVTYDALVRTDLKTAMLGANNAGMNASAYIRLPFTVTNALALTRLTLRMRYDDGFVAYLNGIEVARRNAPASPSWNSAATAERSKVDGITAETIDLTAFVSALQNGQNVLAVQGLNASASNPDFLIVAELETRNKVNVESARWRYFTASTPGQPNGIGVTVLGAVVSDAQFSPPAPTDADNITVTARVRPTFDAVTNVTMFYRVMFSNEIALPMFDDGAHGDSAANDGVFGATIPASVSSTGQMLRWYVTAADISGTISRWPIVGAGVEGPQYFGTVIPDPAITTKLPVFQYFIQDTNWFKVTPTGPYSKYILTNASVYFAGRFYDNVRVRIRGASSVIWMFPKQSLKFDFNPGERFVYAPDREPVTQINVNEFWTDKAYVRNYLSMVEIYAAAGVPAQDVFFLSTYLNGAWHSVAGFVEEPDERFLRRNGLDPEGALYKMYNPMSEASVRPLVPPGANPDNYGGAEKKTREWEDFSDLQAVVDGIKSSNTNRMQFMFDNLNVPEIINYCAASLLIQDWDRYPKNNFLYRDTLGTREWQMLPWDADLSWGFMYWMTDDITANHATFSHPYYGRSDYQAPYGEWHYLFDALYRIPVFQQMFLRRARTVMDQILQPPSTPANQLKLEACINELQALLTPDVDNDKQRWGLPFGTNQTFAQALNIIRTNYLAVRRTNMFVTHGPPSGLIPASQFPYPTLRIAAVESNPSSGNQSEEYIQLTNIHPFAVDLSGWQLDGGVQFTFRTGTVIPSNSVMYLSPDVVAFRARTSGPRGGQGLFVQGNYQGQLSARGEPLRLFDGNGRLVHATNYPGAPSLAQQYLRVTELMYSPAPLLGNTNDAQEFEFINLKNIGASALDLTGVRFTNGIAFDFTGSAVTILAPGQTVLLVRNPIAFAARYGTGFNIAGQYGGYLDNAGERLQLVDATGEEILDFRYDNSWYPITDGLGFSLVVVNENAEADAWSDPANWRSSGALGGSPAGADPGPPAVPPIVINEALTRTDFPPPTDSIELYNPTTNEVNLGGWFLTDDFATPNKYRIPDGTLISPNGYLVFNESQFNPTPGVPPSFALSAEGDEVYLLSAGADGQLTGYVHGFRFGAADDGVSFGRYVTSDGEIHFVPQAALTLTNSNAGPRVGPVVINEIMYHPPEAGTNDNTADEFIELVNLTTTNVVLFDIVAPTNTWKLTGGVDYVFPTNVALAPNEFALLVNIDPTNSSALAAFRTRYGVAAGVQVFGPYGGKLNNDRDNVELKRPTLLRGTNLMYVLVDQVSYWDSNPWPAGADGFGLSLQRLHPTEYANEPTKWTALPPTAAAPTTVGGTPPVITGQPTNQTVLAFTPASFSVKASGATPLRYQWRFKGANLAGATNATLSFDSVPPEWNGDYEVVVFNAAGSTVSSNATLMVNVGAVITQQPASQTVRQGVNVTNTVVAISATGSPLKYQWRVNGLELTGRTNASLTLSNVLTTNSGVYTVLVTDAMGTVVSAPAMLYVAIPPSITQNPLSQPVVAGGSVTFSVMATGTLPMNFQWRFSSTPLTNYFLNQGVSFFTLQNVQATQAGNYRVVVSNVVSGGVPGSFVVSVQTDFDRDKVPDAWESLYGFGTNNASDASMDFDGDTMSNWAEYIAGTDPTNALSYLKVDRVTAASGGATLEFYAISNRTYTVEYTDSLDSRWWERLADLVALSSNHVKTVQDPSSNTNRFYRLVTPRRP